MKHAHWTSRIGFILAAAGSAIGLGAIWKFPYTAGTNGGAVFFLIFLMFTVLVGLPVLLAEFYIGRSTGKNAIDALKTLSPHNHAWAWIGRTGVFGCFVLLSFYSVVGGWVLAYFVHAMTGSIGADTNFEQLFGNTISSPLQTIGYQSLFMLMTIWVVRKGISDGIEKANRYMMPALFIMFIILAIRSLTLPNASAGVTFLLKPDFSAVTANTMLTALGQAFFALSLGVSTMATYAAYLERDSDLFRSANSIMWMNMAVSLLAGLVIFPAVFAFGFKPDAGPGLIFIVLPAVFQQIPFGTFLFAIFMILITFATLTSAFSMLETVIAATIRGEESRREKYTWGIGIAILLIGIPSALSFGVMGDVKLFGKTVFDLWDYVITSLIMPICALATTIFIGYIQNRHQVWQHMREGSTLPETIVQIWYGSLRYIAPIAILLVFANTLGLIKF